MAPGMDGPVDTVRREMLERTLRLIEASLWAGRLPAIGEGAEVWSPSAVGSELVREIKQVLHER